MLKRRLPINVLTLSTSPISTRSAWIRQARAVERVDPAC